MFFQMFDTHSHYDDKAFDHDRDDVINKQFSLGVKKILNCAVDISSCENVIDLIRNYDFIYGACGIHPGYSEKYYKTGYIDQLYEYHKNNKVLAVGEIGLDYFYKDLDINVQKDVFYEQLIFAENISKPVVIHCREAHQDTINMVKKFSNIRGIVHCFSGSYEIAKQWIDLGFYLGIGGVLTFKNAKNIIEVVKKIPLNYILTETDCPYLSPEPFRGKRNESINMEYVIRKISEIRNEDFDKIADTLYKNALKILNL